MIQRVLLLLLFPFALQASHIIGGNFEIVQTGPNSYDCSLIVYRDCRTGVPNPPVPLIDSIRIGVFDLLTNQLVLNTYLYKFDSTYVELGDSCYKPTNICVQEIRMFNTLKLPDNNSGYLVSAQICCRNYVIDNITSPGSTGITWTATIPKPQLAFQNSTPDFGDYPALGFLCLNNLRQLDLSATDADGDSLYYQFAEALTSPETNPFAPQSPPYSPVNWRIGHSYSAPIISTPPISIDGTTGILSCTASQLGIFVFAYEVQEYRNGVLIGTVRRDLQIQVLNCLVDEPPVFILPTDSLFTFEGGVNQCVKILVVDSNLNDSIVLISRFDSSKVDPSSWASLSINSIGVGYNPYSLCWTPTCSESVNGTSFLLELEAYSKGCSGKKEAIKTLYFTLPSILDSLYNALPNIFTPNGDGQNDIYQFPEPLNHACLAQVQMKIYNRWGKMVYENPVPEVQWDGTIQGREVPDGVYFYVVEGVFNSITISRKGTITILR